jgi:hypothetical protein
MEIDLLNVARYHALICAIGILLGLYIIFKDELGG